MSVQLEPIINTSLPEKQSDNTPDQSSVVDKCTICFNDVMTGELQVRHDGIHPLHTLCAAPLYAETAQPPCPSCRAPLDLLPDDAGISPSESLLQHTNASLLEGAVSLDVNEPFPLAFANRTSSLEQLDMLIANLRFRQAATLVAIGVTAIVAVTLVVIENTQ